MADEDDRNDRLRAQLTRAGVSSVDELFEKYFALVANVDAIRKEANHQKDLNEADSNLDIAEVKLAKIARAFHVFGPTVTPEQKRSLDLDRYLLSKRTNFVH